MSRRSRGPSIKLGKGTKLYFGKKGPSISHRSKSGSFTVGPRGTRVGLGKGTSVNFGKNGPTLSHKSKNSKKILGAGCSIGILIFIVFPVFFAILSFGLVEHYLASHLHLLGIDILLRY
jgi:hypothetical protein